jgi:hypothetical protein
MKQAVAGDAAKVDARHYKVEYENAKVRVLRAAYGPKEKSTMHSHPGSIAVFLTDAHYRFTFPDGRTEDGTAQAGQCMWVDSGEHLPENLENKPFEVLVVELKS